MQKTEMMQMATFNHRENILKISWEYPENIVGRENIVKNNISPENIVITVRTSRLLTQMTETMQAEYRENTVKISWKYRENIIITLRKSRLLTQMTEMMQAEYRENIVKMSSSG